MRVVPFACVAWLGFTYLSAAEDPTIQYDASGINIAPFTSGAVTYDIIFEDLDNDGDLDLIYANNYGEISIALNQNAGGLFSAPNTLINLDGSVRRLGPIDWNGDGKLDLILCIQSEIFLDSPCAMVLYNNSTTTTPFETLDIRQIGVSGDLSNYHQEFVDGNDCQDMVLADLNGDGVDDIVMVVNQRSDSSQGSLVYFENDGNKGATLRTISDDLILGAARLEVADLDSDGHLDIVVLATDRQALFVFFNDLSTQGGFTAQVIDLAVGSVAGTLTVGALRSENFPEIICVGSGGLSVYQNFGGRIFEKLTLFSAFLPADDRKYATIYDCDGNGLKDILVSGVRNDYAQQGLHIFSQKEPAIFSPPVQVVDLSAAAFMFVDIDGDGLDDLVVGDRLKNGIILYLAEDVATSSPVVTPTPPPFQETDLSLSPTSASPSITSTAAPTPALDVGSTAEPPSPSPTLAALLTVSPTAQAVPATSGSGTKISALGWEAPVAIFLAGLFV